MAKIRYIRPQDPGNLPPPKVTGLVVTGVTSSSISLSWNPIVGAASYVIYHVVSGSFVVLANGVISFTYTNTGLPAGNFNVYAVSAVNAYGEGQRSNTVSATTTGAIPLIVTGLTATAVSSSQINLAWTVDAGATSYNIFRNNVLISSGGAGTSFNDTGLAASTTYSYKVSGTNSFGTGPTSNPASATTFSASSSMLAYIATQSTANGGHILCGAYGDLYGNSYCDVFYGGSVTSTVGIQIGQSSAGNPAGPMTGLAPAILGFQPSNKDLPHLGFPYVPWATTPLINSWNNQNGISIIGGWMYNPDGINPASGTSAPFVGGTNSTTNATNFFTPGSTSYINWHNHLADLATYFKTLNNTVIWRPFIEPNLSKQWWWDTGSFTPAQQKQMWIDQWNYMQAAGVTNLLWCFNANAGTGGSTYMASYPGDQYVDIVSMDAYPMQSDSGLGFMYANMTTPNASIGYAATKTMIVAECGVDFSGNPGYHVFDWDANRALIASQFPTVCAMVTWFQGNGIGNQLNAQNFMNNTTTLGQVPAGLH